MLVHNIKGTSDRKPHGNYKSWLDFWEKKKDTISFYCSCKGCDELSEVGGHVQKHGNDTEDHWYIVPLCKKCNDPHNTNPYEVNADDLVRITEEE